MAQDPVNVGTSANDRTGDPLRTAFQKLNANDAQLFGFHQSILDFSFLNVKTDLGCLGGAHAGDSAILNAAMQDSANMGRTLYFPADIYKTTTGLTMTSQMNIIMDQRAVLRGDFAPADGKDVLRVDIPASGLTGDGRSMIIEGGSIFCNGGGRAAIAINTSVPMQVHFELEIRNGNHAGELQAIRIGPGNTPFGDTGFNTIRNCNLSTLNAGALAAVNLEGCSDGNRIIDNLIFGVGTAVRCNVVLGAFNTIIKGNGLVTRNGALIVVDGSLVIFEDNQVEQNGVNGLVPSSSVLIQGLTRISRAGRIINNNFGGGSNVDTNITLYNARGWVIDRNQFNITNAQDINFGDSAGLTAMYNTIGPNNWFRGARAATTGLTDTTRRMTIAAAAATVGNRGFWKPLPTLQNGWTAGTGLQFMVDQMGNLRFKGILLGGTLTAGTLICTLPAGARPQTLTYFPVATPAATVAMMQLDTNGELKVHSAVAMPHATVNMSQVSIPVEWLDTYEVGE